jgi:hypothetical protein
MTGFFGVGGGFLIVPTLAVALALSMRMAVGASLVIIIIIITTSSSVMALSAHLAAGRTLDVGVTFAMTVSAIAGALAGVRLAERVPQRQLGQGFAALVVVVAAYLLISAAFLGGPPAHPDSAVPRSGIASRHSQLALAQQAHPPESIRGASTRPALDAEHKMRVERVVAVRAMAGTAPHSGRFTAHDATTACSRTSPGPRSSQVHSGLKTRLSSRRSCAHRCTSGFRGACGGEPGPTA